MFYVKKLSQFATVPARSSAGAAGYDIYSAQDAMLSPDQLSTINTGIAMQLPFGTYGRIASRSSYANKKLYVQGGVIDSDYRGEVKVLIHNMSEKSYLIKQGDRIAQLIVTHCAFFPVTLVEDLDETIRGEGGFGSTGV